MNLSQGLRQIICLLLSLLYLQIISLSGRCFADDLATPPRSIAHAPIPPELKAHLDQRLKHLVADRDAAIIVSPQGEVILSRNSQTSLIPASTLKILTALLAIHHLGYDYRFATDFYLDRRNNLKVKGFGDPLLVSEILNQIAGQLTRYTSKIKNIVIDDSYFQIPGKIPGKTKSLQPYDAPNGAFCVNFNTVAFKTVNHSYVSDETQTPLLPFALAKAKSSGLKQGRIMLAGGQRESIRYAGELLQYFLRQSGIQVDGQIQRGKIDTTRDKLIFHHLSPFTLDQVITRLMEFSNNFIANQLFIAAGGHVLGEPATLAKGISVAESYLEDQGLRGVMIVEGSGISRQNRISAETMIMLLKRFKPHHQLLRHEKKEYYKTGTLSDVKSRAGYLEDNNGRLFPFAVLINTPGKTPKAVMQLFRQVVAGTKK